ncbi:MAG: gamma-glutamylcyclotransferase [Saprospiraceae bacterium]
MNDFLFVYGTLMNNIQSTIADYLHQNSDFIGEGSFPGKLYDLGSYPGAIYNAQANTLVYGHVFKLHDSQLMLKRLDFYEGINTMQPDKNEYRRELVPVQVNNDVINCWVYLYNFKTEGLKEIVSGDYLAYYHFNNAHQDFTKSV